GCQTVRAVLSVGEIPRPCAVQRHTLTRSHWSDQSHARATVAPLSCPRNSTSHRARTSNLGAAPPRQRDTVQPLPALGTEASTPSYCPVGAQVPFFAFFQDGGRTDAQHPGRIANATRIQGHIDDLVLDRRRLTRVGIGQQKCSPTSRARATPVALLAVRRGAMPDDIGALAIGAVEDLGHHHSSLSQG